jgi:hypothetical protein
MCLVALAELSLALWFYPARTIAILGLAGVMVVVTWWLWRSLNEPRYRRMSRGECPECGYDLRGSTERCSECGAYFGLGWSWRADE